MPTTTASRADIDLSAYMPIDGIGDVLHIEAFLPHPVSVNAAWRHTVRPFLHEYKTNEAMYWQQEAAHILMPLGLTPLPEGEYRIKVETVLYTVQMDIDNPNKLLKDLLTNGAPVKQRVGRRTVTAYMGGLRVNDRFIEEAPLHKRFVAHYADQGLELVLDVWNGKAPRWRRRADGKGWEPASL